MSLIAFRNGRFSIPVAFLTLFSFLATFIPPRPSRADSSDSVAPISLGTGGPSNLGLPSPTGDAPGALATVEMSTGTASTSYPFQLETARGAAQPRLGLQYRSSNGVGFAGTGWSLDTPSIVRRGSSGMPRFSDPVLTPAVQFLADDTGGDDYLVNGQLLVPIAVLNAGVAKLPTGETFPPIVSTQQTVPSAAASILSPLPSTLPWVYFRREVDDDGSRYFFNGLTWLEQTKSGNILQFGLALDNVSFSELGMLEGVELLDTTIAKEIAASSRIYRWNLVRESDPSGNTAYYSWDDLHALFPPNPATAGTRFLTDIYDTLPSLAVIAPPSFAHHVRLTWQLAQGTSDSTNPSGHVIYDTSPIWMAPPFAELQRVDVTSATWTSPQRHFVRGYSLFYTFNGAGTRSFLTAVQSVGANCCPLGQSCGSQPIQDFSGFPSPPEDSLGNPPKTEAVSNSEFTATFILPDSKFFCFGQPPTTYAYSGVNGQTTSAPASMTTIQPFPIANTVPGVSPVTALADLDGDGIADLVTTDATSGRQSVQLSTRPGSALQLQAALPFSWTNAILGNWVNVPQLSVLSANTVPNAVPFFADVLETDTPGFSDFTSDLAQGFSPAENQQFLTYAPLTLPNRAVDIDGDGLTDLGIVPLQGTSTSSYTTLFTARDRTGQTLPFFMQSPASFCPTQDYDPTMWGVTVGFRTISPIGDAFIVTDFDVNASVRGMVDVDGDGLADLVSANKFQCTSCATSVANPASSFPDNYVGLLVLPGRGDGRFGLPSSTASGGCTAAPTTYGQGITPSGGGPPVASGTSPLGSFQSDPVGPGLFTNVYANLGPVNNKPPDLGSGGAIIRLGDLNADGMADYAVLNSVGLSACIRTGLAWDQAYWRCETDTTKTIMTNGAVDPMKDIQIADLDGSGVNQVVYFDSTTSMGYQFSLGRPPASTPVRDGLLQSVTSSAGATTQLVYQTVASQGVGPLPVPEWVVKRTTTNNNVMGSQNVTITRDYSYSNPIYDARDRLFVGFQSATETREGGSGAPGLVTKTTFGTQLASNVCGATCSPFDYGFYRGTRGLPVLVETSEQGSGLKFHTTFNEYHIQTPYSTTQGQVAVPGALDGRTPVLFSLSKRHTYLWDETSQSGATSILQAYPDFPEKFVVFETFLPPVQTMQQNVVDNFGNTTSIIDSGLVGSDIAIIRSMQWGFGTGDTSGWSFRLLQQKTSSGNPNDPVREFDYSYNAQGLLTEVFGVQTGSVLLPGPNAGSPTSRAAPQPPSASVSGKLHLKHLQYDQFGNRTLVENELGGASGDVSQCVSMTPDPVFQQLPASLSTFPAGCNTAPLTTTLVFDRGLEKVVSALSPEGRLAQTNYDPFGRVAATLQPDPVNPMTTEATDAFEYNDNGTVHIVLSFPSTGGIKRTYTDSLGLPLGTVTEAGETEPATQWVVAGMTDRAGGRVVSAFQPFFLTSFNPATSGTNASGQAVALPFPDPSVLVPSASFNYDGLGRLTTSSDFNRDPSLRKYHTATLSVDSFDAEQIGGTTHKGAFTTVHQDGFGRIIETDHTLGPNGPEGAGVMRTFTQYLPTGEPRSIEQQSPDSSITRTIVYDTLGRMVQNEEPNSGTWTYAYNDSGQLVGLSDARGCGENLYRDGQGRVIAEDYSPCLSSQPAYSAPNLSSGQGAEVFNVFDNDGLLVKAYDRAQFSVYGYDGRARLSTIQRRIAAPATGPGAPPEALGSPPSPSGINISGVVTDDVGTPRPGVTVNLSGTTVQTRTTDANGQYSFSGLGPGNYSVQPGNDCTYVSNVVNTVTSSQVINFKGSGGSCGPLVSTPIAPQGNITISGFVVSSVPVGQGIQGATVTLNGTIQAVTETGPDGAYAFSGLAPGSYSVSVCNGSPVNLNNISSNRTEVFNIGATETAAGLVTNISNCGSAAELGGSLPTGFALDQNYTPHVFEYGPIGYDTINRPVHVPTGADLTGLAPNGSRLNIQYKLQGPVDIISSSYDLSGSPLLNVSSVDAAGRPLTETYGDVAKTTAMRTYDGDGRFLTFGVSRNAGTVGTLGAWTTYAGQGAPTTADTLEPVLTSLTFLRDGVGNPTSITTAGASPWPGGAEPAHFRDYNYYDDYRLKSADLTYDSSSGTDSFDPPYTSEEIAASVYPRLAVTGGNRVTHQGFGYDWRGNITSSVDSTNGVVAFFDRGLGTIANGGTGVDQFSSATAPEGTVTTHYDAAGNLLSVTDTATATQYTYSWDELGRLQTATRADNGNTAVSETFAYNAAGGRVLTSDQTSGTDGGTEHTVAVFASLVLKDASFTTAGGDYERDLQTEQLYLSAGGRLLGHVAYDEGNLPQATSGNGKLHVYMPFADPLGSTGFVIDHDTSEVVEAATYLAYGAAESDFRPARWNAFREDIRYTGHWDDAKVGLSYFGARYYSPELSRFISPDPVSVHRLRGDPNPYAYAMGSPLRYTDPVGLQDDPDAPSDDPDVIYDNAVPASLPSPEASSDQSGGGCIGAQECSAPFYQGLASSSAHDAAVSADNLGTANSLGQPSGQAAANAAEATNEGSPGPYGGVSVEPFTGGYSNPEGDFGYAGYRNLDTPYPASTVPLQIGFVLLTAGVGVAIEALTTTAEVASELVPATEAAVEGEGLGAPKVGDTVYRVYGENNNPLGQSWTRVDPSTVENFREAAGLPDVNTGRFVIEGQLTSVEGVTTRGALELDGHAGGLDEVVIPNASQQVEITNVSGANPEF
jgi:RHS repeat-associated protein